MEGGDDCLAKFECLPEVLKKKKSTPREFTQKGKQFIPTSRILRADAAVKIIFIYLSHLVLYH